LKDPLSGKSQYKSVANMLQDSSSEYSFKFIVSNFSPSEVVLPYPYAEKDVTAQAVSLEG
jgi:hypothetical protein